MVNNTTLPKPRTAASRAIARIGRTRDALRTAYRTAWESRTAGRTEDGFHEAHDALYLLGKLKQDLDATYDEIRAEFGITE